MAPLSALDVAGYLVSLAGQVDESDLTNLKLQKLLYFAQGEYLKKTGKPLFEDEIVAWQYGPVVRSVYDAYKGCGAFPITVFDVKTEPAELPDDVKEFVKWIWTRYGKYSASYLVTLTHRKGSPWDKVTRDPYAMGIISLEHLAEAFGKS
jgi:uncharacterized phage-associated protein